jgi:hypothetical protein
LASEQKKYENNKQRLEQEKRQQQEALQSLNEGLNNGTLTSEQQRELFTKLADYDKKLELSLEEIKKGKNDIQILINDNGKLHHDSQAKQEAINNLEKKLEIKEESYKKLQDLMTREVKRVQAEKDKQIDYYIAESREFSNQADKYRLELSGAKSISENLQKANLRQYEELKKKNEIVANLELQALDNRSKIQNLQFRNDNQRTMVEDLQKENHQLQQEKSFLESQKLSESRKKKFAQISSAIQGITVPLLGEQ